MTERIDHPPHYGGGTNPFEAIKIIEGVGWGEGFNLGNAVKYTLRAGKKPGSTKTEDLNKAIWYLQREIERCNAG